MGDSRLYAEVAEGKEEPELDWVDDGSLPLSKEGDLPFYFFDAHEDAHVAQTVYLFGKARLILTKLGDENEASIGISSQELICNATK